MRKAEKSNIAGKMLFTYCMAVKTPAGRRSFYYLFLFLGQHWQK
jgi:hypothetical protein